MKHAFFALLLGLVGISVGCGGMAPCARHGGDVASTGISVAGHGESEAAPDLATIRVGVEVHRATMAETRSVAAATQTRVLEALQANGVATADVQTSSLTFQPDYQYGEGGRRLAGYVATNTVQVRVRRVDSVGAVVDAVVTAAGDEARVDEVRWEIEDPTAVRAEARRRAVADARARAEALAHELGVSLGAPIVIEEVGGGSAPSPLFRMAAAAGDASTPVASGVVQASVDVQVRWAIAR